MWVEFGKEMGAMLSEIAIGTQVGEETIEIEESIEIDELSDGEDEDKKVMIEQIALGLFDGALDEEHLEDVVTCATVDAPHAVGEIEAAVKDMEQKSVTGVISGLDEMAKAFSDMSMGLKTCANKKNADQVEKIIAMVETFKNPETLALHVGHDVLFNGVNIEQRINAAVAAYNTEMWVEFGKEMGAMLSEIAIGTQLGQVKLQQPYATEAAQIATGLLKGAVKAELKGDITKCLKDGTLIYSDAKAVVADLEEKSLSGVIHAAKDIYNTVSEVKIATTDCTGILADW